MPIKHVPGKAGARRRDGGRQTQRGAFDVGQLKLLVQRQSARCPQAGRGGFLFRVGGGVTYLIGELFTADSSRVGPTFELAFGFKIL